MEDQLDKRREQILGLKRQNLEERLKVVAGDMSDLQIKELRAQFDREYDQLEKTIREEKEKQLNNMRQALLQRRIAKEKKRKQAEQEEQRNLQKKKQQGNLKEAFRKMIEKKAEAEKVRLQKAEDTLSKNDLLRTKLKNWEKEKRNPAK